MTPELYWLTVTAVFTSVLWAPHILQRIIEMKPYDAFRDPRHDLPTQAPWAQRAARAHSNAVENLVVFGALVMVLNLTDSGTQTTATAAALYFFSRVLHYGVYVAAFPWARTPVYLFGWGCLMVIAAQILG